MNRCVLPPAAAPDAVLKPARSANDVVQAVLFAQILKPLTAALGPVGDTVVGSLVERVFVRTPA